MHDPVLLPASRLLPPTSPALSYPKLSWAAQRAWLCVTPCQVLLEAVRWQPPSLSALLVSTPGGEAVQLPYILVHRGAVTGRPDWQ